MMKQLFRQSLEGAKKAAPMVATRVMQAITICNLVTSIAMLTGALTVPVKAATKLLHPTTPSPEPIGAPETGPFN